MKIFSDQNIKVIGSGRTDAGVHANGQVANVNIENSKMNESQIKNAINSYLPNDIFINDCTLVKDEFYARFTAKKREYFYYISNNYHPKNRFYVWNCKWKLDLNILNKCSELLIGNMILVHSVRPQVIQKIKYVNCMNLIGLWMIQN